MILELALGFSMVLNLVLVVILYIIISDYMGIAHSLQRLHNSTLVEKRRLETELSDLNKYKDGMGKDKVSSA